MFSVWEETGATGGNWKNRLKKEGAGLNFKKFHCETTVLSTEASYAQSVSLFYGVHYYSWSFAVASLDPNRSG